MDNDPPFSSLMTEFEKKKTRRILVSKIRERFEYIKSFPELLSRATSFHRKLSTLPMIKNIITTNWDGYFETVCDALPFVTDEDMVFWDGPERKVLKIHGTINNLGSLVVTDDDYRKCYQRLNKNLIGSELKTLLARKTLVFVGYSFKDSDFIKIYSFVDKLVGRFGKNRFIVTTDKCRDFPNTKLIKGSYLLIPVFFCNYISKLKELRTDGVITS